MDKKNKLQELKLSMQQDKNLPLRNKANKLVFADGSPDSEILFIGEAPGYWEDVKGIPFVGNAGMFLNQLIQQAGLKREDVFITNIIFYRPPDNRDPYPDEIVSFSKYLDEIIRIIQPKAIITLGRFSMAKFAPGQTIGKVHGKVSLIKWEDKSVIFVPMYHPAAGLRNPSVKQALIMDFQSLRGVIEKLDSFFDKKSTVKQMTII